ncbi:hypothetical protein O181_083797 [Austropuccinia psidii MF-1]|uniref:Uncharacterized protein n=1 Tax=Austropuccinia psidii MF-1 TaxID=1389203 RepID=A0A9Q3FV32_9BASI|nr:hypothetical protein [Austropuccinia psidii MF-1]
MTLSRSGRNYSIQSNGSGPGHSSQKSKRQEFQPSGEAKMGDARTSISSQRLASTFEALIESPEADITAIPVVRPESFPTGSNRDIPVSVKELVYGGKVAGVGTSANDKAELELKEDIQSSINNISLKNEFPRQSPPILERNVLSLNNDLHHTISINAEVETACSFKDIPELGEWPTFSGEGEYNHMIFMKTIGMFKEDFNIPDEYISARLHSLFTK